MLRLYDYLPSGNGYKVRLPLTRLGIPFERVELDIVAGETRTPAYLAKNANGRIPLLELDDGTYLAESNAVQFDPLWADITGGDAETSIRDPGFPLSVVRRPPFAGDFHAR